MRLWVSVMYCVVLSSTCRAVEVRKDWSLLKKLVWCGDPKTKSRHRQADRSTQMDPVCAMVD